MYDLNARNVEATIGMKPLCAPEIARIDSEASPAERAWNWLPLIGWAISGSMWTKRVQPIVESIHAQLLARPEPPAVVWGEDTRRQEIANTLCAAAKEEMGWPNDRFLPNDPVNVVFWAHEDGLDVEFAAFELEDRLHITIAREGIEGWFGQTLDDVVTWLCRHVAESRSVP